MTRQLAVLVLSVAIIFAAVVAGPCTSGAACATARARMDCCNAVGAGISAPRCCNGPQQVSRAATPATAERPPQSAPATAVAHSAPLTPARTSLAQTFLSRRVAPGADPPGGTLIAQHTSLLL